MYPTYPQYQPTQFQPSQKPMRTPFVDIDTERASMSADEVTFVTADPEFQRADNEFRSALFQFIEMNFRDEFLRVDSQGLSEKKLLALKVARERYKRQADTVMSDPEVQALIAKKRSEKSGA